MNVRLPVLVKDYEVAQFKGVPLTEPFTVKGEDVFLDGPVSRRVAAIDFDPVSGDLTPGVRFRPPASPKGVGTYELPDLADERALASADAVRVTTFAGVHKTLAMFEEKDCLGRKVDWAFEGPQLLVVPRAGEWANAYYERESRSLQFFSVTTAERVIHTCHSQDIIAHETAHAIIDGVAPDLYHSQLPEGLALHEALADIATLLMAFRSRHLAAAVLEATGGSIRSSNAFTGVAGQLGGHLKEAGRPLRELWNDVRMDSPGLDRSEPHALSEVLSGALYRGMVDIYEQLLDAKGEEETAEVASRAEYRQWAKSEEPRIQEERGGGRAARSAGRALWIASERFKRTVLRALDYLPPGEVSFSDFARALLASDEASHPDNREHRRALVDEFVRRGIVRSARQLDVRTNYHVPAVAALDLEALVRSDWLAYDFAAKNRKLLRIPATIPFEVRPRLDVTKRYYHREGGEKTTRDVRECLLKVTWSRPERCGVGHGLPRKREVRCGTTLAIDWATRTVRAVVTNQGGAADRAGRDAFLGRLLAREELALGDAALGPDGKPLRGVVRGDASGGMLRLGATARALHMAASRGGA